MFDTRLQAENPFWGSREDAERVAANDDNEYAVERVLSYRGDPEKRTTCTFKVLYTDGDVVDDLPWSENLSTNE